MNTSTRELPEIEIEEHVKHHWDGTVAVPPVI
jgi:hypothetical protein